MIEKEFYFSRFIYFFEMNVIKLGLLDANNIKIDNNFKENYLRCWIKTFFLIRFIDLKKGKIIKKKERQVLQYYKMK